MLIQTGRNAKGAMMLISCSAEYQLQKGTKQQQIEGADDVDTVELKGCAELAPPFLYLSHLPAAVHHCI